MKKQVALMLLTAAATGLNGACVVRAVQYQNVRAAVFHMVVTWVAVAIYAYWIGKQAAYEEMRSKVQGLLQDIGHLLDEGDRIRGLLVETTEGAEGHGQEDYGEEA